MYTDTGEAGILTTLATDGIPHQHLKGLCRATGALTQLLSAHCKHPHWPCTYGPIQQNHQRYPGVHADSNQH